MLVIVLLWFAINGPLVSIGAYVGTNHGVSVSLAWAHSLKNSPYTANTTASPCKLNPSPNPTSALIPEANPFRLPCRNPPLWCSVY
jgi:hypothetical protein